MLGVEKSQKFIKKVTDSDERIDLSGDELEVESSTIRETDSTSSYSSMPYAKSPQILTTFTQSPPPQLQQDNTTDGNRPRIHSNSSIANDRLHHVGN